jgi:hypothetical protein
MLRAANQQRFTHGFSLYQLMMRPAAGGAPQGGLRLLLLGFLRWCRRNAS